MRSFNRIATFYDYLTFVIFGRQLVKANICYASMFEPNNNILILGGGSGALLPHLPENVKVDFVDPSGAMLDRAKKRLTKAAVTFHETRFEDFNSGNTYDCIVCPFFLDLYNEDELNGILQKINLLSHENTILWVSDFHIESRQKTFPSVVLSAMKLFFRLVLNLRIKKIADVNKAVFNNGWRMVEGKSFYMEMMFSRVYLIM